MSINSNISAAVFSIKPYLLDYLSSLGIETNKNFKCIWPDHNDSSPSTCIVGRNTENPRVYCHGCGRHADIFDAAVLLEKKPNTGLDWVENTLKYLATRFNITIVTEELTAEQLYELDTYRAYKAAAALISATNTSPEKHQIFLDHIKQRQWDLNILNELGIGTVSSFSDFRKALKEQGFSAAFLDEIDLGRKDIFSEDNLIFTWKDEKGRPIGFTSRNLNYEEEKATAEENGTNYNKPKYNNQRTTGLKCNIFQKGKRFFGIHTALKDYTASTPLYIFEGQADYCTAYHAGLKNCVALAGSSLHSDHVLLLKELGIYNVVLCLDGDETGRKKLEQILKEKFAGHRDMKVSVIILPSAKEINDPDAFIRNQGLAEFLSLAKWTAFEWYLNRYTDEDDPATICQEMIPFIVNEPSAVAREQLCKTLAKRTGISLKAISDELNALLDEKSMKKAKDRKDLLERISYELKYHPEEAEIILTKGQASLSELTKQNSVNVLSNEDFVRALDEQKVQEENTQSIDTGFDLGHDLKPLQDVLRGEWSKDVFMCFGGKPNVGKSAFLSKIAFSIATNNQNVCVIYHTIDDTQQQLVPRFVSIAEGSKRLSINMVRQPNYWNQILGKEYITEKRDKGYKILRELAQEGRLIVKDIGHGATLPFAENIISYYQDKYPERKIVYILDNFHKLHDFNNKEERVRFKLLSETIKGIALRKHITIISSVEYTKLAAGIKPTNHNIGETSQIEYDANFIAHLYSEVSDIPGSFSICHRDTDWKQEQIFLPRVEVIVGKNKITEQKVSLFFDFWPSSSDYRWIDQETVLLESKQMKQEKQEQSSNEKQSTSLVDNLAVLYDS